MGASSYRRLAAVVRVLFILPLVCCGGPPTRPDSAEVTLAILTPTDVLKVGASVDMRLQVTFSDGRFLSVTPVWTTDRPDIIDVKPLSASRQLDAGEAWDGSKSGTIDHILFARVTGLAPGQAYVVASCTHGTVRQPVRVTAE